MKRRNPRPRQPATYRLGSWNRRTARPRAPRGESRVRFRGTKYNTTRPKVMLAVLLGVAGLLLARYIQIQVFRGADHARTARNQHRATVQLAADRGQLLDCRGRLLTQNSTACSVLVWPGELRRLDSLERLRGIERPPRPARLAAIFDRAGLGDSARVHRELAARDGYYCFASGLDYKVGEALDRELVRAGLNDYVVVAEQHDRVYPYGAVCSRLLGYVRPGDNGQSGQSGLEAYYDSLLSGRPGLAQVQKDRVGFHLLDPGCPRVEPVHGANLRLTIDVEVQQACFDALEESVRESGALGGSAVVLDAKTGAILALADYPSYDPAEYGRHLDRHRCSAVADLVEPGSSFKIVVCAAALESPRGLELAARQYDVSRGFIEIKGRTIKDVHKHGVLSFDSLLILSSNPGVALLAQELEPEQFHRTARALGFGEPVNVGVPGEAGGLLDRPEQLDPLRRANIAFGQGVAVSLLQLAAAYLCVANDGRYVQPYVVQAVESRRDTVYQHGPAATRAALRPATALRLKRALRRVVTEGTGPLAAIPGTEACGKTGTAQKLEWDAARRRKVYSQTKSLMSFAGFFPLEDPEYVIAVMVDEPVRGRFASSVACPVFRSIGEELLALERLRTGQESVALVLPAPGGRENVASRDGGVGASDSESQRAEAGARGTAGGNRRGGG